MRDNYRTMTHRKMAEKLGRTAPVVSFKLSQLKLKKYDGSEDPKTISKNENRDFKPEKIGKNRDFFVLDFENESDLFDGLVELAKIERRTPENQILHLIEQAVRNLKS